MIRFAISWKDRYCKNCLHFLHAFGKEEIDYGLESENEKKLKIKLDSKYDRAIIYS